ncbi:rap1 GTPase-activating protein 1-like isoform X3 [Hydractinia symbiolongicarpus]|uniref:rap1 GTPase-activating protein 1-like isoform X3 n=1 Tax=Hydractinia symbiolongicarpus TaxID=13093 RepID=UPI00254BE178|nr:rap1 GTPase-activating protein 1-like isoform X3 [Hydractinia symbiolongicarpus]
MDSSITFKYTVSEWNFDNNNNLIHNDSLLSLREDEATDDSTSIGTPEEEDFFDILTRLQGSRLDEQRIEMPAWLLKHQQVKMEIGQANEDKKDVEPIKQVLALGAPYPMVVLPVDGEYWMEGNYHVLSRDTDDRPVFPSIDMSRCSVLEDNSVYNYRRHFVGKEHVNFAGVDNKYGPLLLSVMLDLSVDDDIPDQYRIILRLKDRTIDKILPTTTFQADNPGPRDFMKSALDDEVEVERFHPISLLKASDDITKFDEHTVTNSYKVGVVYQTFGQTTEEEYLQNQTESLAFREFLDMLGNRVELKDFPNYRGGLDVKYGQTGNHSYYANHKNRELMFHVSTLLPFTPNDSQQLSRKRHIGNDVVAIIFQEENTPFCPNSFRSHFLHVFIIVQVVNPNSANTHYKVSVTAKDGVPKFVPPLPNPCIFKKGPEFRNFLLTKVLNAEIAAVKSEKFSSLALRTRSMLLQSLVNEFVTKNEKLLEDETLISQNESTSKTSSILSSFRSAIKRSESIVSSNSTGLVQSKKSGHSLSLNDISSLTVNDQKKDLKKNSKEKKKAKKEKRLSSGSLSPRSRSPPLVSNRIHVDLNSSGEVSPTLRDPTSYKVNGRPKAKSRFFTNQLFDTDFPPQSQSLPRNMLSTLNGRLSPTAHSPSNSEVIHGENNNEFQDDPLELSPSQKEIDKLKAEINKLKMDKMDLMRQNVLHQRELKRLNEKNAAMDSYTSQIKSLQQQTRKFKATPTTATEFV